MTYHAFTAGPSGVQVGLWEPLAAPAGTALLLGRTPFGWYDPAASRLPRTLTALGLWCVAVDVPNWGNQTDLDAIDAAVAYAQGQGRDTDRVTVYAHSRGGIAAVNWAVRHIDVVAALVLVSPVIDLEERYDRVTADQASIDAAYGGSLAAVAATWNPGAAEDRNWGRRVSEHLSGRMSMWWSADDTDTPASVHEGLAGYYQCETGTLDSADPALAPASDLADQAAEQAAGWSRQASVLQQRWNVKRRDDTSTTDWGGSDGNHRIPLPDGRAVWTQNDYRTGTINSDETRTGGGITHNCGVVEEADGSLGATLFHTGTSGPWLRPDDHPTGWYWLNDGIVEGTSLRLIALHVVPPGFTIDGVHVVTVDATTLQQIATTARPFADGHHWGHSLWAGPQHTYITGSIPGPDVFNVRTALARATAGDVSGAWEYWDGTQWALDQAKAAPMRDVDGNEVPVGAGAMYKLDGGPWVLCGGANAFTKTKQVYTSLWGPYRPDQWEHYIDVSCEPQASMVVDGTTPLTYGGNDLILDDPDEIVISYEVNHPAGGTFDSGLYQPQYRSIPRP